MQYLLLKRLRDFVPWTHCIRFPIVSSPLRVNCTFINYRVAADGNNYLSFIDNIPKLFLYEDDSFLELSAQ